MKCKCNPTRVKEALIILDLSGFTVAHIHASLYEQSCQENPSKHTHTKTMLPRRCVAGECVSRCVLCNCTKTMREKVSVDNKQFLHCCIVHKLLLVFYWVRRPSLVNSRVKHHSDKRKYNYSKNMKVFQFSALSPSVN